MHLRFRVDLDFELSLLLWQETQFQHRILQTDILINSDSDIDFIQQKVFWKPRNITTKVCIAWMDLKFKTSPESESFEWADHEF